MKLYYRPRTSGRPGRVAWLLEELGLDYETVAVPEAEMQSPEHLDRQPLGRVPAVEFDDGTMLFDSTAIVLQIADLHPDGGLISPVGSVERGLEYQWVFTAQTELERAAITKFYFEQDTSELFASAASAFAQALDGHEFLVGERFSVADIVTVGVLGLTELTGLLTDQGPARLHEYLDAMRSRPAYGRALERTESIMLSV